MKPKYIIIFLAFTLVQIAINITTPGWFADAIVYANDMLLFLLLVANSYIFYKSRNRQPRLFIAIHTLALIEILLLYLSDDCDGSLFMRFEYYLYQLTDRRIFFISDHAYGSVSAVIFAVLVVTGVLEYFYVRRSRTPQR